MKCRCRRAQGNEFPLWLCVSLFFAEAESEKRPLFLGRVFAGLCACPAQEGQTHCSQLLGSHHIYEAQPGWAAASLNQATEG